MVLRLNRRGFTLVEAAMSVLLVGVLLVASTGTFGAIARNRRSQLQSRAAILLAQQLMTEIMQASFQQPSTSSPVFGPVAGVTRPAFAYVDAYDGYVASPPVSKSGTVITDYAGWTEGVSVAFVDPTNPSTVIAGSTLKRITVTITSPSGMAYVLVGLRSKLGPYEAIPSALTTYVTGASVTVQGSASSTGVYTGSHPLNESTSQ